MNEILMLTGEKEIVDKSISKLRFYFLTPQLNNSSRQVYDVYAVIYYLEFKDANGIIDNSTIIPSASSFYSATYDPSKALLKTNTYWSSEMNNIGNPDMSCWFEVDFGEVKEITEINLLMATLYSCDHILIHNQAGVKIAERTSVATPIWPLSGTLYTPVPTNPRVTFLL